MRWRFQDPGSIAESSERQKIMARIDRWWEQFARRSDDLDRMFRDQGDWDVVTWMESELLQIDDELSWEFRPSSTTGRHELAISPDQNPAKIELVKQIVAQAPKISGWDFSAFRNSVPVEACLARTIDSTGIDLANVMVSVHEGKANQIDCVFRFDKVPGDEETVFQAMLIATETLLGEQPMLNWLGSVEAIDRQAEDVEGHRFVRLSQVPAAFDTLIETITDRLSPEPFWNQADQLQWAAFELKPKEAVDYARRDDLLTAMTCDPELTAATFESTYFASHRFSRCGETFCYVKVDERGSVDSGFADREDMEEAIRATLETQELGCLIGSGAGLRYSYLELALTDLDEALKAIRETLQEGRVSRRSWVLFHDAQWTDEWFPIYEGASAPLLD